MNGLSYFLLALFWSVTVFDVSNGDGCGDTTTDDTTCFHGEATEAGCACPQGWTGNECQHCQGRFVEDKESGCISDGDYDYERFVDCSWLIKLNPIFMESNTTLRIKFDEEYVSCDGLTLRVYDGDGEYSPLLATYSGMVKPGVPFGWGRIAIASSGTAFLKFESPSPIGYTGYRISYAHVTKSYRSTPDESYNAQAIQEDWMKYQWTNLTAQGRGSASLAPNGEYVYVYGGFFFGSDELHEQMLRFKDGVVSPIRVKAVPEPRFGHTMISWEDTLLVYGGIIIETYSITNDIWSFNITSEEWTQITLIGEDGPPLVGHSSNLVKMSDGRDVMVVIFGYHPEWRYSNFVFEYDIATTTWSRILTNGAIPLGAYGHASGLDDSKNHIYIHGGLKYGGQHQADVYVYYTEEKSWRMLNRIPSRQRYLHSMVFIDNALLVFRGRSVQMSELCEDINFESYDIATDTWKSIPLPNIAWDQGYGQSAAVVDNSMYIFGVYDGIMQSDVLIYTIGTSRDLCSNTTDERKCTLSPFCTWANGTCLELSCSYNEKDCDNFCELQDSCVNCLSSALRCCSCKFSVNAERCFNGKNDGKLNETEFITDVLSCDLNDTREEYCDSFKICDQCNIVDGCAWRGAFGCKSGNDHFECRFPCLHHTNCVNCTAVAGCVWSETTNTCIPSADDGVFYPYMTSTDWRYQPQQCADPCAASMSCNECEANSKCGWCALDVDTGLGKCMSGEAGGSVGKSSCTGTWYFTNCPTCQCNGHSVCMNESVCANCTNGTDGEFCEYCQDGYYGDAVNGGNCTECECNGHAETCKSDGDCNCNVYGMTGDHCQSCVDGENISKDAANDTCYYDIKPGFRYKFPVVAPYTEMNFNSCPQSKSDLRITFASLTQEITTGQFKRFDLVMTSYYQGGDENETIFHEFYNITQVYVIMRESNFDFGGEPLTCLRFYTTFETPFTLQVEYVQSYSNVGMLLGAFFAVFLFLLIIVIAFWKVNEIWRRRQMRRRREVELQIMAARPLACVDFEYNEKLENEKDLFHFGEEVTFGGRAAVGSVLLMLPYGTSADEKEPNIAIGSTLLCSKQTFKNTTLQAITMRCSRKHINSNKTSMAIGIENPVLDLQNDIEDEIVTGISG